MLKKRDRLTAKDIESLSLGKSVFGTLVSLRYSPAAKLKISVSVSKKELSTAADRNRARRRVSAIVEKLAPSVKRPAYALVMPKKAALDAPFDKISADVSAIFSKAGLLG